MANEVDPRVIGTINRLLERLFRLTVRQKLEKDRYEAQLASLKRRHTSLSQGFSTEEQELSAKLRRVIAEHYAELVGRGRSFATMIGIVQFRKQPEHTVIADKQGIMQLARKRGLVRQIADPPSTEWQLNPKKLSAFLERHPEYRAEFEPFLTVTPAHDSVSVKPNNGYTVNHDNKRLTPPATSLGEIETP